MNAHGTTPQEGEKVCEQCGCVPPCRHYLWAPCPACTPPPTPQADRVVGFDRVQDVVGDALWRTLPGVRLVDCDEPAREVVQAIRSALQGPHAREVAEGLGMPSMKGYWAHPDHDGEHSIALHWDASYSPLPSGIGWLPLVVLPSPERGSADDWCPFCLDRWDEHTPEQAMSCRADLDAQEADRLHAVQPEPAQPPPVRDLLGALEDSLKAAREVRLPRGEDG